MQRLVPGLCALLAAGIAVSVACNEAATTAGPTPNPATQRVPVLVMQAGDSQFATVGRAVPINPVVRVVDDSGRQLQDITVTFTVTSGGGSATGTTAVSDSAGLATVGSWTLGPALGTNTMTAAVSGHSDPIVFIATALCDCWKDKASLSGPRYRGGSAVIDGKVYVVGGQNGYYAGLPLEVYDPASDTWTSRAGQLPMMTAGTAAALNGRLYLAAGTPTQTPVPYLQSYDPQTDRWTSLAAPPKQRDQFVLAPLNGQLYLLGGYGNPDGARTVEAYDPATDTWTTKAPMLRSRNGLAVAVVNATLYAIGGETEDTIQGIPTAHVASSVEAYDPATDTWTAKASLPVPVTGSAAAVVDGIIYVVGGGPFDAFGTVNVYAYDPTKDKWTVQPQTHAPRSYATASVVDGTIYVIGGIGAQIGGVGGRREFLATVEAFKP